MPFCPNCFAEYREGFNRCSNCDEDLVEKLPEALDLDEAAIAQAMDGKDLVPVARGALDALRENKALLAQGQVASVIVPDEEARVIPGAPRTMLLVVSKDDVEASAAVLGQNFQNMVSQEGLEGGGALDASHCPACGTSVPPETEECPECGLFVGKA